MKTREFKFAALCDLVDKAGESFRGRQHRSIHAGPNDPCQRIFNAINRDSYIRPHRHSLDPKSETLIAVQGLMALVVFNNDGGVADVVRFGSERYVDHGSMSIGVELAPDCWHTVIALVDRSVLFEVKPGPFDAHRAKELADWAPEEGSLAAKQYLSDLLKQVDLSG